jgi:hypothetical protein
VGVTEQKTLFKRVEYDVQGLLHFVDMGDIGLPDIQRPFVWSASKVRDLFDSMYRGFPVGYLLFWENANVAGARTIGIGAKGHAPGRLIVDGQQRLTSLYAVMRNRPVMDDEYREVRIDIGFRPRDGKFDVTDAAIRRDPEYISSISDVWARGNSFAAITEFLANLGSKREVFQDEHDRIVTNIDRLFDIQHYPFTALEIAPTVTEEQVADIFVRINSLGAKLNQADFILTLMSVFWDEGRANLEHFSRDARREPVNGQASPFNPFFHPQPDQLLRTSIAVGFKRARLEHVYSILRGKDLDTGLFTEARRDAQFELLRAAQGRVLDLLSWHEFWKAVAAAGYRDRSMISSENNLAYTYAMFLIGHHDFGADWWTLKKLLARWLFMTSLTGRYSSSFETAMDADLSKLRGLSGLEAFVGVMENEIVSALTDDFWSITLPNLLATAGARSPYLLGYHAALNIINARALFSQERVADLLVPGVNPIRAGVERHHLFPKAYLTSQGIPQTVDQNQIANLAIIGWEVNADISDEPPSVYWPRWVAKFGGSSSDVAQMRYWHALPEGWEQMEYGDFLAQRRRLMAIVIRDGFAGLAAH